MNFTLTVIALVFILVVLKAEQVPPFAETFESVHKILPSKNNVGKRDVIHQFKWMEQNWIISVSLIEHGICYAENDAYFKDGGAMFIYLGGAKPIESKQITRGIIPDLAKKYNGILFLIEHRYYGESRPTSDLSVDNMQYLNVKQALADLAHFIRTQRKTDPRLKKSKVIIAGCSYAGSMAIWFSKLYPDLVDGVFASSAPILAKLNHKEYSEIIGEVLKELGSQKCYDRVKNGINQLNVMFSGRHKRPKKAKKILNLCSNFDDGNILDMWNLFTEILHKFADYVQYQSVTTVPILCNHIMSFQNDLTAIAAVYLDNFVDPRCVDATYNSTLNSYVNINYTWSSSRQWFYQSCNEFGWFPSTAFKNQLFGCTFHFDLRLELCYDVFGEKYTAKNIHQLIVQPNELFGGKNSFPTAKNIYVTQGAYDPWRSLFYNVSQGASVIPKASHCPDFGSITENDSHEVRASKERLVKLVGEWVKQ